ncbi:MAG: GspE/PulE family protein [Candidatus Peregrinibacteria bacterium]|nr:GspE/PulE family protein [Candidatus Peregrinibacteria bacterium]MDZ4244391.1 GspE/PulE family protein [Candidatus Gracilibacteria bacterium]
MAKEISQTIIDFLLKDDFITQEQFYELKKEHEKTDKSFEKLIIDSGLMTDPQLGSLIANQNGWQFVNLRKEVVNEGMLRMIPEKVARKQKVIAFLKTDKGVKVAMNNPKDTTLVHLLSKRLGKVIPYFATNEDIEEHLTLYKSDIQEEFEKIFKAEIDGKAGLMEDSTTVKIIDVLIARAYESNASDIHIEPYEDETVIRFRIDGVMHDIISIPRKHHDFLISRIKVMAKLRTDEHQTPQDGKLEFKFGDRKIDVRISVVPTTKGENSVMRLLSDKARNFTFDQLGYSDKDFEKLMANIKKPWGMILATGPTGSGKTTNLYAILKILNQKEVNIATIENPVEYNIDGMTQIQVNPKAELTFASGLKSIVRQDPDIIMVGEIRDSETADIAVNSAMTGHLVLSTLHTNDAATTIPRLLQMGVEPFLISSTVNVTIGQRLVRKICPKCIHTYEADVTEFSETLPVSVLEQLARGNDKITLYKGAGCELCAHTGYLGRVGIFEVLEVDDDIRELIMKNSDADTIKAKAVENGMTTMFDDAREKVLNGVTTIEEMLRVVRD